MMAYCDAVLCGKREPLSLQRRLIVLAFGFSGLDHDLSSSFRTSDAPFDFEPLDVLGALRKGFNLRPREARQLEGTIRPAHDSIAELLNVPRQLGHIDGID